MKKAILSIVFITLGFIVIITSIFAGIRVFKLIKAESYINGTLNVRNVFETDYFNYASNSVVFYEDAYSTTAPYYFKIDLVPMLNFNGEEKEYKITLNKYELLENEISAGLVITKFSISFYDVYNQEINTSNLNIRVTFLSSKTELKIVTTTGEEKQFLESYFNEKGFNLMIEEVIN